MYLVYLGNIVGYFRWIRRALNETTEVSYKALVSMGAVGAIAPMVFESLVACTRGFGRIFLQFISLYGIGMEIISNIAILAKIEVKHPHFEIPNEGPELRKS